MIKAKPVVSNKFWVLQNSKGKIGEVNATSNGYIINIKGKHSKSFKSLTSLKNETGITFIDDINKRNDSVTDVNGYSASGKIYNPVWNTKLMLPLYTKKEISKSWFAAGYYHVNIKGEWHLMFSPKLILLQRNEYLGPFVNTSNNDLY